MHTVLICGKGSLRPVYWHQQLTMVSKLPQSTLQLRSLGLPLPCGMWLLRKRVVCHAAIKW